MSKLFCGILPLEVETGRYQGVKRENRLCRVCEREIVEDEIHFLFSCRTLRDVRKGLLLDIREETEEEEEGKEESEEEEEEVNVSEEKCVETLKELVKEENIKSFAEDLEILFNARQRILYR